MSLDIKPIRITVEIDDPAIIIALLCRGRGRKWPESCEEAQRITGRVTELRRQVITQQLGKLVADTVKRDPNLMRFALDNNIGD